MKKIFAGLLVALVVGILPAQAVLADDVTNSLDNTVDSTFEAMGLVAGGATGTNTYSIVITNEAGGKNGCNFTGGSSLTVSVNSSNGSVATVSPSSLTFTNCNDTKVVTVTPVGAGTSNITLSQTSNTTPGLFNLATAGFTVNVTPAPTDVTAPVLALPADITSEATGPSGAVVNFTATATDNDPAHPVVTCTPASGSTFSIGTTEVNCSATDTAGNIAQGSFNVTVQDTTAPVIAPQADLTLEATSPAGAMATFALTATDLVDGSITVACDHNSGDTFALGTTLVTCTATDAHSNTATKTFNVIVQDTIAPTINLVTPVNGASYSFHQVVLANYSCADSGSGVATCGGTSDNGLKIDTASLGAKNFYVIATDNVGNTANTSVHYTVVGYTFGGFQNPITIDAKTFNKTSTIPVKFVLKNADGSFAPQAIAHLSVNGSPAVSSGGSNSGDLFRYDTSGNQYIFNLSTKPLHTGVNTLKVTLDDGSTQTMTFTIK